MTRQMMLGAALDRLAAGDGFAIPGNTMALGRWARRVLEQHTPSQMARPVEVSFVKAHHGYGAQSSTTYTWRLRPLDGAPLSWPDGLDARPSDMVDAAFGRGAQAGNAAIQGGALCLWYRVP